MPILPSLRGVMFLIIKGFGLGLHVCFRVRVNILFLGGGAIRNSFHIG